MAEELTIAERQEEMKLVLAETLMKTIPTVPDNFHELSEDKQNALLSMIDSRTEKIMALLGAKKGRGPTLNPRGPRRVSERFNTPQLDIGIAKKRDKKDKE